MVLVELLHDYQYMIVPLFFEKAPNNDIQFMFFLEILKHTKKKKFVFLKTFSENKECDYCTKIVLLLMITCNESDFWMKSEII